MKDRENYSKEDAEKEMLLSYVRNYMHIDPRRLSEQQMNKLLAEAKKMMDEDKDQTEQNKQPMDANKEMVAGGVDVKNLDERIISPDTLKDIFDKMTIIDTNPADSSSVAFEKGLEQMERKNTAKK